VNTKFLIAVLAFIALVSLNFFISVLVFLYSASFQISFLVGWLVIMTVGLLLRRSWCIYVAQSIVTALITARMYQYIVGGYHLEQGNNPVSLIFGIITIVVGYLLAWCIARAISVKNV
jgi:hypothetical protein